MCGSFAPDDECDNVYRLGDFVIEDKLKNLSKSCYKFFIGKEIIPFKRYEINSGLRGWSVNVRLSKTSPQYSFFVYIFLKVNDISTAKRYECVCFAKSPPFSLFSSRRNRIINKLIKLESNNSMLNIEECKSDNSFLDSLEKLKEKINPNSFKYKKLMPHIYDEGDSETENKGNDEENNKNQYKNYNIYSFESLMNVLKELSNSEPNTVCNVSADPFSFDIRIVERIDPNREDITYHGSTIEEAINHIKRGFEYLDKYGNIHRIIPSKDSQGFPLYE